MAQITNNIQNDTIDLREVFPILKRRKKLISLVTMLITIIAIVYAFFIAKPVYEVKALMEIAQVNNKPIQNVVDLKEKIEFLFEVTQKIEFPLINSINLPKKTRNMIIIQAQGHDNSSAEQKLREVVNHIISLQDKELNIYTDIQKKKLNLIKEDIDRNEKLSIDIKKDINIYENKLLNISKQDTALAIVYAMEIGRMQTEINEVFNRIYTLKNQEKNLELSISSLKIKKAKIIGKLTVLNKPIKPKKPLIIIIAFIASLILSILLAFSLEFIKEFKRPTLKVDQ